MKMQTNYMLAATFVVLSLVVSKSGAMNLKVVSIDGSAGAQVEIALEADDSDGLGPIQMLLLFDSNVLEIVEVESGDVYEGSVEFRTDKAGELAILMLSDADKGVEQDGVIAVVKAKVIGEPGQQSALGLRHVRAWKRDTSSPTELDVVTTDGQLIVVSASLPWLMIAVIAGGVVIVLLLGTVVMRRPGNVQKALPLSETGPATVACSKCGNENEPQAKFCAECGNSLKE